MFTFLQKLEKHPITQLHRWIVLIAMLIAAQVQYIQHGWINPDSVLYLEAAKAFSQGVWKAGFEIFPWPFYALCIAFINKITQLGVHVSAQILNVIFFSIATYSFIKIITLAGGKQRQIIAGALIWLSAKYMIGGVLEMLMRDEGFWAFYLLGLVFFIRFYQLHQTKDALLWQACIIVATLFRIEAILFLMLLPLILLFQEGKITKQKCQNFLLANSINISLAIVVALVFAFNDSLSTKLLGRLNEVFTTNLWQQFTKILSEKSAIMSNKVLGKYLEEFATQGLLMTFLYVMFVKSITATGLVNVGLSALAIKHNKHLIDHQAFQVLRATAIIALLNMALIIVKVFVLSSRYVLAFSFILMVLAAFYLAEILFGNSVLKNQKHQRWLALVLVIFMLGSAVKNLLPKKAGYNYQQAAVTWILKNNKENKPVFYDEKRLRYFAGEPFYSGSVDGWQLVLDKKKRAAIGQFSYLVISHSKNHPERKQYLKDHLLNYQEIAHFKSVKSKNSIVIYQRK